MSATATLGRQWTPWNPDTTDDDDDSDDNGQPKHKHMHAHAGGEDND